MRSTVLLQMAKGLPGKTGEDEETGFQLTVGQLLAFLPGEPARLSLSLKHSK